jgi:hypothetical protein
MIRDPLLLLQRISSSLCRCCGLTHCGMQQLVLHALVMCSYGPASTCPDELVGKEQS